MTKNILAFLLGIIMFQLFFHFLYKPKIENKQISKPTISECDSIHLANDSLKQRIGVLENRIRQYKIGLSFLKDKDKKSYDYVINAGNFIFNDDL